MRLKGDNIAIDYNSTKDFFSKRAEKYNKENPYGVTMYQDKNHELVIKRNSQEVEKILPLLKLNSNSIVLDIACGVGRWADAITENILRYYGIDFSEEFIDICEKRIKKENYFFKISSATEVGNCFNQYNWLSCNRIIIAGILMYLNDDDVNKLFYELHTICQKDSIIYVREPIGITERLTLENHYSEELETQYSAIYRTKDNYVEILKSNGFEPTPKS